ncbi:hypothetical protein FRC04_012024 [Tulasnella sp. 424]|nr:hypothetical protein FRC04_012024 [Tulasnella sp. 424]KAG8971264.1 hypothetical protein FRC05_011363 [Tulasnella sp. 425]
MNRREQYWELQSLPATSPPVSPRADEHTALRRSPASTASDVPPEPPGKDENHTSSIGEPELCIGAANPRHRLLGFLPTAFVLLITLGFACLILRWLLARQYEPIQGGKGITAAVRNGFFIVYEGGAPEAGQKATVNLRVLTFSALVSHLISDTSSVLMTLVAYRAGSQWLQNSRASDLMAILQNPTPLQYGLLVRLLGSSSIMAIYETGRYAVHSKKRSRLPRLFKEAFALAIIIWVMSHAVGLADLYLHTTTRSILADIPVLDASPGSYQYAVAFNETLCTTWPSTENPCLSHYDGWALENPEVVEPGFLAMANRTESKFNVITLADADDAAIVVPGAGVDLSSTSFTAQTFSARAHCRSLNHNCERSSVGQTFNCTPAGYPGLPYYTPLSVNTSSSPTVDNYIFGIVNGQQGGESFGMQDLEDHGRTPNPVTLGIQMRWNTHIDQTVQGFTVGNADSAVDIIPPPYITLYAGCSVTFSNVTVRYLPSDNSWKIMLETQSSDNFTTVMWAPTIWQLGTQQLASEMMTIAMTEAIPNVTAALNQHLARIMLGVAIGTLQPAEATDVKETVPSLLGQYPVAPVMLLIALLLLYALLAIIVFTSSWLTKDETIIVSGQKKDGTAGEQSVLNLTQRWLVDPLPLVAAAFPGEDGKDVQRTVADSATDMVYDGSGADARLSIGLRGRDGFGLRKRGDGRYLDE